MYLPALMTLAEETVNAIVMGEIDVSTYWARQKSMNIKYLKNAGTDVTADIYKEVMNKTQLEL